MVRATPSLRAAAGKCGTARRIRLARWISTTCWALGSLVEVALVLLAAAFIRR